MQMFIRETISRADGICDAKLEYSSILFIPFIFTVTDRLRTIIVKVHKWESSLFQVPKLISGNLNGEFINSASLLCASTCWFWSSEGGCDAWAEGMCMLWCVERHTFPHSFARAVPHHVLYHYRVITDVIIHNEVISEKRALLIIRCDKYLHKNEESGIQQCTEDALWKLESKWNSQRMSRIKEGNLRSSLFVVL